MPAKAKGSGGENPARWRGHLDHLLPRPSKLARGHHAAMPFEDVAVFIASYGRGKASSRWRWNFHSDRCALRRNFWELRGPKIYLDKENLDGAGDRRRNFK